MYGQITLPSFDTPYMSKDFGLDITIPDGGLVSSAASQREYQSECRRIYKEFLLTMGDIFQEEDAVKQELRKLNTQRKFSQHIGRPGSSREDVMSDTLSTMFSRSPSRADCFITKTNRPQTSIGLLRRRQSINLQRPSTVADCKQPSKSVLSHRRLSVPPSTTSEPCDGAMDSNINNTKDRKLKMNPAAFSKFLAGEVNIKLQQKAGVFVLKPVADKNGVARKDLRRSMDCKETMALVKQKTNYKSSTLSSDLKINNLLAIQKSLRGFPTKRTTVREIMSKAKDRRARLFQIEMAGSEDIKGGIHRTVGRQYYDDEEADDMGTTVNDGVQLVTVEARKRRMSSAFAMSQDGEEMKKYKDMYLKIEATNTPRGVKISPRTPSEINTPRDMYINTGSGTARKHDDNSDLSENEKTPRIVTSRDTKSLVRQSLKEDSERESELNRWRQRMSFAAVKRNELAHVLNSSRSSVSNR